MTQLTWDQPGDRTFRAGLDRGVLYLTDAVAPWNGLTSVDESPNWESQAFYQDGVKYLDHQIPGEFAGKLTALTYPDEFEPCIGIVNGRHDQRPRSFGLTYRIKLGDALQGLDLGYEIHVHYNLRATPDGGGSATLSDQVSATEMSWALTSTPELAAGIRPTSHLSIKSTNIDPELLALIEGMLYGTEDADPHLPPFGDLVDLLTPGVTP